MHINVIDIKSYGKHNVRWNEWKYYEKNIRNSIIIINTNKYWFLLNLSIITIKTH